MVVAAAPSPPRFEHFTDASPIRGVGTGSPRLSWSVPHTDFGYEQTAYEIEVTRGGTAERYRVDSTEQILVPWPARPLASREFAALRVRVAHKEEWSTWSGRAVVETGLLERGDWTASFISPVGVGGLRMPAPVLSGTLHVPGDVHKARLYVTAHGLYAGTVCGSGMPCSPRAGQRPPTGSAVTRTT